MKDFLESKKDNFKVEKSVLDKLKNPLLSQDVKNEEKIVECVSVEINEKSHETLPESLPIVKNTNDLKGMLSNKEYNKVPFNIVNYDTEMDKYSILLYLKTERDKRLASCEKKDTLLPPSFFGNKGGESVMRKSFTKNAETEIYPVAKKHAVEPKIQQIQQNEEGTYLCILLLCIIPFIFCVVYPLQTLPWLIQLVLSIYVFYTKNLDVYYVNKIKESYAVLCNVWRSNPQVKSIGRKNMLRLARTDKLYERGGDIISFRPNVNIAGPVSYTHLTLPTILRV